MDFASFLPACLLLWIAAVASHVAPPENVTLYCRNFHNELKWSYPEHLNTSGLKFIIDINSYQNSHPVLEREFPHADVSFLNNPYDSYYVTVTAVVGNSTSTPAPEDGITFSYYQDSQVEQKCFLDLPPVNITLERDNKVQISFVHPFVFHRQSMKKSEKREIPTIKFRVMILNQTGKPHTFMCERPVCKWMLPVDDAQQNHCLNISGETTLGPLVKPTEVYCTELFKEPHKFPIVFIVIAVLAVGTIAVLLCMAYHKITKPSTPLSRILEINKSPTSLPVAATESVHVDNVEYAGVPSSPTPLLLQTEEEDKTEFISTSNSTDYDLRLPIGVPPENGDGTQEGQPNEEGPDYMPGNLDNDDETSSANEASPGYEKRGTVLVDLGQDETAKGYRG